MLVPAVEVVPVELIPRVVHGEQDFHFHRAIRPGDKLVSRAKMIGYEGLEKGTRAAILVECRTEDGELVNEQYVTCFFRGHDAGVKVGELCADPQVRRSTAWHGAVVEGDPARRQGSDVSLRAGIRRPDADPPRRGGCQGRRAARHHRTRNVHDGLRVVGGADRGGRLRGRPVEAVRGALLEDGHSRR